MYKFSKYAGLQTCRKNFEKIEKNSKKVLTDSTPYNKIILALRNRANARNKNGVWLSLARALDLGSRGRRFESCHPDFAGVVQW